MDLNKLFQSRKFKVAIWIIGGLAVLLFVFRLGIIVGYRKANFSYRWGENYHRNFGGPRRGLFGDFFFDRNDFINSHGTFGQIIKIDANTVVVKGKDDVEKVVLVGEKASLTRFRDKIVLSDLKVNDYVVVIGDPNDSGQIEAKFIRVMPPPGAMMPPPIIQ